MDLQGLAHNWNIHAENDPMWAVLMDPNRKGNRWDPHEFYQTGMDDVVHALETVQRLGFFLGRRRRAFDFGCGVGRLSQALACYFDEVDAVDIAPAMIRQARNYNPYGDRCRFHVNTRDDLGQFPDNQFDFIFSILVLQHMHPQYAKRYIAEFVRILAPRGMLLFAQPSHYSRRAVGHDYRTWDDRLRLWMETIRKRIVGKIRRPVPRPIDHLLTVPKHQRLDPVFDWNPLHVRIDGAIGLRGPRGAQGEYVDPETQATTELHTIPRREMLAYLKRLGGRVIHVEHRIEATPHHPSYRYFVTKS